ncbi:MAG: hypothetical protein ACI9WR_001369, partial [Paracoccaceae bacterium]
SRATSAVGPTSFRKSLSHHKVSTCPPISCGQGKTSLLGLKFGDFLLYGRLLWLKTVL